MRIHFEQTGGFMGRKVDLELDLSELADNEAESIRLALEEANFFALPEDPTIPSMPDELHYCITVETKNVVHSVRTSDTAASSSLQSLIQNLSQLARTRR